MRRLGVALLALAFIACGRDEKPSVTPASSSHSAPTTTAAPTTVPPTTATPLAPIADCADPGPLAQPDPDRPSYRATANVDVAGSTVTGEVTVRFTPDIPTDELV